MKSLGERNNNPLNIRRGKSHWQGEALPQRGQLPVGSGAIGELATEGREGAFVRFESVEWGLRAAFILLRTYRNKYKAVCIRDIITRWAPPSENDTSAYIRTVCKLTGFGGNERLTENEWPRLVQAMALIESGMHLSSELIAKGFELYRESKTGPSLTPPKGRTNNQQPLINH